MRLLLWCGKRLKREMQGHPIHGFLACYWIEIGTVDFQSLLEYELFCLFCYFIGSWHIVKLDLWWPNGIKIYNILRNCGHGWCVLLKLKHVRIVGCLWFRELKVKCWQWNRFWNVLECHIITIELIWSLMRCLPFESVSFMLALWTFCQILSKWDWIWNIMRCEHTCWLFRPLSIFFNMAYVFIMPACCPKLFFLLIVVPPSNMPILSGCNAHTLFLQFTFFLTKQSFVLRVCLIEAFHLPLSGWQ